MQKNQTRATDNGAVVFVATTTTTHLQDDVGSVVSTGVCCHGNESWIAVVTTTGHQPSSLVCDAAAVGGDLLVGVILWCGNIISVLDVSVCVWFRMKPKFNEKAHKI